MHVRDIIDNQAQVTIQTEPHQQVNFDTGCPKTDG